MRFFTATILAVFALVVTNVQTQAQDANKVTVGIIAGGVGGTYARFAQHMMDQLDSEQLRVIPMLGKGSRQNIKDLVGLNGVDVAIVQNDVMTEIRKTGEVEGVEHAIRYITKLYNEEVHIITRRETPNLKSLTGQKVAVGRSGSGTEMTATNLFDALGFDIDPVTIGGQDAITAVKDGTVAAAVFVVGKPGSLIAGIGADEDLKLLEITAPKTIDFPYFETTLDHADYPDLIPADQSVDTLAVGAVMAVFNWREGSRRYDVVARFTSDFLDAIPVFQASDLHPKWLDVDPYVDVPGWTRFKPAQAWLQAN